MPPLSTLLLPIILLSSHFHLSASALPLQPRANDIDSLLSQIATRIAHAIPINTIPTQLAAAPKNIKGVVTTTAVAATTTRKVPTNPKFPVNPKWYTTRRDKRSVPADDGAEAVEKDATLEKDGELTTTGLSRGRNWVPLQGTRQNVERDVTLAPRANNPKGTRTASPTKSTSKTTTTTEKLLPSKYQLPQIKINPKASALVNIKYTPTYVPPHPYPVPTTHPGAPIPTKKVTKRWWW